MQKEWNKITIKVSVAVAMSAIIKERYNPTWDLFSNTLGWFQLKKELPEEGQKEFERTWRKYYSELEAKGIFAGKYGKQGDFI